MRFPVRNETGVLVFALLFGFLIAFVLSLGEPSIKEVSKSIEIVDLHSKWIPWHPPAKNSIKPWEKFIAPRIIFKVKNVGKKTLRYVAFNAVFLRKRTEMKLGTAYILTLRDGLRPGQISSPITMTSDGGYAGTSYKALHDNPFWEPVICRLYIVKGEHMQLIGVYDISNKIEIPEVQR